MAGKVDPYAFRPVRLNGREYLPEPLAREYIGRGRVTLWEWRRRGWVDAKRVTFADGRKRVVYGKGSLRIARKQAERSKANQRHVPGPGRGHKGARDAETLAEVQERAERRRAERERAEVERRAALRAAAEAAERAEDAAFERGELTR